MDWATSSLGGGILLLVVLVLTKPSTQSFKAMLRNHIKTFRQDRLLGRGFTSAVFGGTVDRLAYGVMQHHVDDLLICSVGTLTLAGKTVYFLGIFNTWFAL